MTTDKFGYERIDDSPEFDGIIRESHEYRYQVAGRYTKDTDTVLDSACGTGYGRKFLKGHYVGVDKFKNLEVNCLQEDLETWVPRFEYDVFISIETIEHLYNYTQLVKNAKNSKRIIVISTPIIPTVVRLPNGEPDARHFHVQDFTMDKLKRIFEDEDWKIIHEEIQNNVYGIIVLQKK